MASAAQTIPEIPDKSLFTIAEVARLTSTKPFVLRFWESEFPTLQPTKAPNGRRLYRREDIEMVFEIKRLLYDEGFTIAGARKHLGGQRGENSEPPLPPVPAPTKQQMANSRAHQKFLLDLHEELLAILTLLERG
jgi:DNA-binding transcriptional MerR regulator